MFFFFGDIFFLMVVKVNSFLTSWHHIVQIADMTKHLPHIWDLCAVEIVVRSAKHILKVACFM